MTSPIKYSVWADRFLRLYRNHNEPEWKAHKYWDEMLWPMKKRLVIMLQQNRCNACKGPFHPATGHRHSEKTVLCGPCAKDMLKWVKAQTNRKWGGVRFYDHAFPPLVEKKQ